MKRRALAILLSLATLPAMAQDDPLNEDELRRQLIEQILEQMKDKQGGEKEIEELRERLKEQLEERFQELGKVPARKPPRVIDLPKAQDVAPAEPNPLAKLTRDQVVALLDHKDYPKRQQAESFLMRDKTLTTEALGGYLKQSKSYERRQRLLRVAEHVTMRNARIKEFGGVLHDKAAIGFSYAPVVQGNEQLRNTQGLMVASTMPGFPAHEHLRPGDIITAIDGRSARHQHGDIGQWVSNRIGTHRPGDRTTFTVLRGGKTLRLVLECAQSSALNNMYTTTASLIAKRQKAFERLWAVEYEKLTADLPKPEALAPAR